MKEGLTKRFIALDVFRGMTICLMIIVNTPGNSDAVFAPLNHSQWNGCTPTDLVFPSFLFAVGNAMSFVMNKWQNLSTTQVLTKIFKRTIIIFLVGFILMYPAGMAMKPDHSASLSEARILGVLQRIALAYCAASLMIYFFTTRTVAIVSVIILILYWPVLMYFGDGPDPLTMQSNAVLKLDTWAMGKNHLWTGEGIPFDPEGILSTFPSIVNVVAGYLVGSYIQKKGNSYEGLAKLLLAGFICFVIAYWGSFGFPINKKIWTSTFVLHTVGLDCMILACIIYLLDFSKIKQGVYFFQVFGRNPLLIYVISIVGAIILYVIPVSGTPFYSWAYQHIFSNAGAYLGSLLFAIAFMLLCWTIGYILDKRKIYVKV